MSTRRRVRVGVLGFGHLGQHIVKCICGPAGHPQYIGDDVELAFVWNRSPEKLRDATYLKDTLGIVVPLPVLESLDDLVSSDACQGVDVLVEVAHPTLYVTHGEVLLQHAPVFVGSPTAFAQGNVFETLSSIALNRGGRRALLLPAGALWGSADVVKMAEARTIGAVSITMRKPPHSFRLEEPLQSALASYIADISASPDTAPSSVVLYDGPVRGLCPLAPNNVNTMACLAIASGPELGFDGCHCQLVADRTINAHVIDVTIRGKPIPHRDDIFEVTQRRYNPCDPYHVTASATYPSFIASLRRTAELLRANDAGLEGIRFV